MAGKLNNLILAIQVDLNAKSWPALPGKSKMQVKRQDVLLKTPPEKKNSVFCFVEPDLHPLEVHNPLLIIEKYVFYKTRFILAADILPTELHMQSLPTTDLCRDWLFSVSSKTETIDPTQNLSSLGDCYYITYDKRFP